MILESLLADHEDDIKPSEHLLPSEIKLAKSTKIADQQLAVAEQNLESITKLRKEISKDLLALDQLKGSIKRKIQQAAEQRLLVQLERL